MQVLVNKWDSNHPTCAFQYYFYNSVDPDKVPFYGPSPNEDERKWEEALSNKPSANSIPVLARGFEDIHERVKNQSMAVSALQTRLHEINNALSLMKDAHDLDRASRINEAKRKHIVFTQRTLALATKVQILRNRGYDMDQAEEGLKKKLIELERKTFDPVLGGRQEEIWARMSGVRERARILQEETERMGKTIEGQQNGELLNADDQKALEKVSFYIHWYVHANANVSQLLKDYDRQLEHLKKWVDDTKQEFEEWETAKKPTKATGGGR
jgi:nuclear pore complex protein Nup54